MRKTFNIKWLLDHVNNSNATGADEFKLEREAQNMLLEKILMEADAYRGFGYLSARQLEGDAMSVGIREQRPDGTWNFDGTDHTRVEYFIARGL